MHMHVCLAAVLDPATMPEPYSFKRMRSHIASRVPIIPPFRRVLHPTPLQVHHPVWVDDEHFDVERHVHRVKLGTKKQAADLRAFGHLAGTIASVPLDRSRPLWDLSIVEGLEDGLLGLVVKVHHSAMDGTAGLEILYSLFDLEARSSAGRPTATLTGTGPPSRSAWVRRRPIASSSRCRPRSGSAPPPGSAIWSAAPERPSPPSPDVARTRSGPSGGTPLTRTGHAVQRRHRRRSGAGLRPGRAGRREGDQDRVRGDRQRRRAGPVRPHPPPLPAAPRRPARVVAAGVVPGVGAHRGRDRRRSATACRSCSPGCRPSSTTRSTACGCRARRPPRPSPTSASSGPSLLGDWAELADPRGLSFATDLISRFRLGDRIPAVHNVVVSNLAGPTFPVYLGGARLEQAYPMGPGARGRRPQHHGAELPRHGRHRVHRRAEPRARPLGPGRTTSSRPSPSWSP